MPRMTDASEFDPFGGESQEAWPLLRALREASPVVTVAGGLPVRDALGRVPGRHPRHHIVLERVRDEGARRRDPVRGPHPRRARPARAFARPARDGDGAHPDDGARRRAVHAGHGRHLARCDLGCDRRRPRRRVHRAAAEPRDRAPARIPRRGRRSSGADGEGADGERVPAAQPHRSRRRLRQRVSRVRRVHRRADRRARSTRLRSANRAPMSSPGWSRWRSTVFASPARRRGPSRATSSPVGSRRRASCSATCCIRSSRFPGSTRRARADDAVLAPRDRGEPAREPADPVRPRGCVRDTSVADVPLEPGARVVVGIGCANRDAAVFADGEDFRFDRDNADQHLSFGYGPHVCPGATLAARRRPHRSARVLRSVSRRLGVTRTGLPLRERVDLLRGRPAAVAGLAPVAVRRRGAGSVRRGRVERGPRRQRRPRRTRGHGGRHPIAGRPPDQPVLRRRDLGTAPAGSRQTVPGGDVVRFLDAGARELGVEVRIHGVSPSRRSLAGVCTRAVPDRTVVVTRLCFPEPTPHR